VILAPALAKSLRERWLASRYKARRDFVSATRSGAASTTATSAKLSVKRSNGQGCKRRES
jgi:hypothetical protein